MPRWYAERRWGAVFVRGLGRGKQNLVAAWGLKSQNFSERRRRSSQSNEWVLVL